MATVFEFVQSHHQVPDALSHRCKEETCWCLQIKKNP